MTNRRSLMLPAAVGSVLLTMMALVQAFAQQRWFMPSVAAVGVAFGTGWLARRLDVPGLLAPALSALAMLALLGLVFLPETTAYGFPTAATMQGIGDAIGAAATDIREMAPPAQATEGLTLLATAGVFVVATIVDLLVFWLRRPVAAGLPLLALYLIPTSMASDTNILVFVFATSGYLGILLAEGRDRARAWGRRLSGIEMPDEFADVSHVARVGRRIGSAAVGIALCVPLALPSVGDGILDGGGASGVFGRGSGDDTAYVVNPIVAIRGQLLETETRTLFRVRTPNPQYLRLTSLDEFNGNEWTIVHRKTGSDNRVGRDDDERIPTPRELDGVQLTPVDYEVEVGALAVNWLPLAYAPQVVDVKGGDWRYEDPNLAVFSADRTSQNVKFRAKSLVPEPSEEQLRMPGEIPAHIEPYLQLPDVPVPDSATAVLAERAANKPTPYDVAVSLNDYFFRSGGFRYDVEGIEGTAANVLDLFLTNKVGYCEQFAAAMAYLARLAGIPARVVVGFTPGTPDPDAGPNTYAVSNKDAHAWPELYFPRVGWVRFEPTPRGDTAPPAYAVPPDARQDADDLQPSEDDEPVPSAGPTASPSEKPRQRQTADDDPPVVPEPLQPGAGAGGGGSGGVPTAPFAGLAAVALVATPSFVGWATRRRRRTRAGDPVEQIHAAWDTLADAAEDAGHPMRAADSPRGAGRRLVASAALTGTVADEVWRLAAAEERARYAATAPPVDGLAESARLVRTTLLAALPWTARARALVFPASSLRRIVDFGRHAVTTGDRWRDVARAKAAGVVRRRRPRAA